MSLSILIYFRIVLAMIQLLHAHPRAVDAALCTAGLFIYAAMLLNRVPTI